MTCVHRWLGMGAGTPAERTAATLTAFESVLFEEQPDLVLVCGDDDSALAAALAAAKLTIAVAHLGLRDALLGLDAPRGDQPLGDRPALRRALHLVRRGQRQPRARGRPDRPDPRRRQHPRGRPAPLRGRTPAGAPPGAPTASRRAATRSSRSAAATRLRAPGRLEQLASALGELARNCDVLLLEPRGDPRRAPDRARDRAAERRRRPLRRRRRLRRDAVAASAAPARS